MIQISTFNMRHPVRLKIHTYRYIRYWSVNEALFSWMTLYESQEKQQVHTCMRSHSLSERNITVQSSREHENFGGFSTKVWVFTRTWYSNSSHWDIPLGPLLWTLWVLTSPSLALPSLLHHMFSLTCEAISTLTVTCWWLPEPIWPLHVARATELVFLSRGRNLQEGEHWVTERKWRSHHGDFSLTRADFRARIGFKPSIASTGVPGGSPVREQTSAHRGCGAKEKKMQETLTATDVCTQAGLKDSQLYINCISKERVFLGGCKNSFLALISYFYHFEYHFSITQNATEQFFVTENAFKHMKMLFHH